MITNKVRTPTTSRRHTMKIVYSIYGTTGRVEYNLNIYRQRSNEKIKMCRRKSTDDHDDDCYLFLIVARLSIQGEGVKQERERYLIVVHSFTNDFTHFVATTAVVSTLSSFSTLSTLSSVSTLSTESSSIVSTESWSSVVSSNV